MNIVKTLSTFCAYQNIVKQIINYHTPDPRLRVVALNLPEPLMCVMAERPRGL